MKKFLIGLVCIAAFGCDLKEVARIDFANVRAGELPFGWIVSSYGKSFPGIWEVDEQKRLFVKYPRGLQKSQINIFFTENSP